MVPMNEEITLDAIEKFVWEVSGFRADASQNDAVRVLIEAYAAQMSGLWKKAPTPLVESHLSTLNTLARQLLDTGGRMRLDRAGQLDVAEDPVATRADLEALGRKVVVLAGTVQSLKQEHRDDDVDLLNRVESLRDKVRDIASKVPEPLPRAFTAQFTDDRPALS